MSKNKNRPYPVVRARVFRRADPSPPTPLPRGEGSARRPAAPNGDDIAGYLPDFPEPGHGPWPLDEDDLPDGPARPADAYDPDEPIYVGAFRALLRMGANFDPLDMEVRVSMFDAVEVGPLLLPKKQARQLRQLLDVALAALSREEVAA